MKYFLIAGEASGDMHAARLITALRQRDSEAVMLGLGGDKMQAAGCTSTTGTWLTWVMWRY